MPTIYEMLSYRRTILAACAIIIFLSVYRLHEDTAVFVNDMASKASYTGKPQKTEIGKIPAHIDSYWDSKSTAYSEAPTLDVVISTFKEPTEQTARMIKELKELKPLQNLTINTFIYSKDTAADVEELKRELNTTNVSILRNVGREAGTYFTHILRNWDNLARHTMFIQAEMHSYDDARNRITDWFEPNTGVLSLGQIESCECVKCADMWDPSRTFPRIEELYSALNGEFCPQKIAISYLGQIIVSAERIRQRGPSTYKYLKNVLEADMEHFIHADPKQDMFGDDQSNPYFGHTIERSYMVLWNCASEEIVKRCGGTDMLGTRRTSDMDSDYCQCVDNRVRS